MDYYKFLEERRKLIAKVLKDNIEKLFN